MIGRLGFEIAVNHALQIAVVAGISVCITRIWARNRPYLAHAIWALVLLKCLMPPVIPSPLSPFSWIASFGLTNVAEETVAPMDNAAAQTKVTIVRKPSSPDLLGHSGKTEPLALALPEKDKISPVGYLVLAWVASTLLILIGFTIRFMLFTSMVHRKSMEVPSSILQQLAELSQQLGIKRKVRVRVLDSQIGPAVMGVWRPTLLLPRVIVDAAEPAQLRLLLAHELIHVRRGDLVWSALQVVAASLWWFHPAVWLTNRFLTRESERSCDEQTIASLGCRPADYARSLVAVLEARQQLTAAPIVPGLRPVDITLKRLERIMRIGHGSRAYTPRWVFAMLIVGAIIVLPGSAWLQAQEKAEETHTENPAPTKNVEPATAVTTDRAIDEKAATATQLMASIIVMEVPIDLVKTIQPNIPHDTELTQGVWSGEVTSDRGVTGQVFIHGNPQRNGRVRFGLPVANENPVRQASDEQPKAASSEGGSLNWILDGDSLKKVEAWLESPADSEIKVISRPKMVFESGSLARMTIGSEHPFVTSVDAESEQPTVVSKFLGVSCDIMATEQLSDKSDNAPRSATVQFELKHSELLKVDNTTVKSKRGNTATVQLPTIVTRCCKLSSSLRLGTTVGSTVGVQSSGDGQRTTLFLIKVDRVVASPKKTESESDLSKAPILERPRTLPASGLTATKAKPMNIDDFANSSVSVSSRGSQSKGVMDVADQPKQVKVLGPATTKGKATLFEPPSDYEVIQAMKLSQQHIPGYELPRGQAKYRIAKVCNAESADSPRELPLLGNSYLQHRYYECSLYSGDDVEPFGVVHIDHHRYVILGE